MAGTTIKIEIKGMKELREAMKKFPAEVKHYLKGAGEESARDVILKTPGLGGLGEESYPPATAANAPPAPYYIRGKGTMYQSGLRETSEKLGTQWTTTSSDFKTTIENSASYARYVVGEQQASFMTPKGWKKLVQTTQDKQGDIEKVFNKWVAALLKKVGL